MLALSLSFLATLAVATPRPADPRAVAILDSAIARLGGADALRKVQRVRLDAITQWQRTSFDARPYPDQPSYETHTDLRDYTTRAWRNTRRFPVGNSWRELTDVVLDTVAVRRMANGPFAPLSIAYVDERRELFAFAPERVLLQAREAADLRALADTTVGGVPHARVAATVDGFGATLLVRRSDGFPAMVRWRAAQPNDFGLAPWGVMEAELWFSRWSKLPPGIAYPMQWDIKRVGRPYKRVTLLAASFDAVAPADSFAVSDSLRAAFFATAAKPMHDLPIDSVRQLAPRLVSFGGVAGAPAGAVQLGRRWVLLEAGQAGFNAQRAVATLRRAHAGTEVAAAIVSIPMTGNGGVSWLASHDVPISVAPGAAPFVAAMLKSAGRNTATTVEARGRWLRVDGDSLWVEPISLPDAPGATIVWVPSLRWAYSGIAASPLYAELALAHARKRGWNVERVGNARALAP